MSSPMSALMGDPAARNSAISDVLEGRALAQVEEDRLTAEIRAQFRQEKKTGPKGPRSRDVAPLLPAPRPRPWIKPTPSYQGMPIIAIERTGELRIRSIVRREMTTGDALHIRVAAQDGQLWLEPCPANDPYARRVGSNGDVKGGSLRRELAEAGFAFGRSYLVTREPDGCWVARADQPASTDGKDKGNG